MVFVLIQILVTMHILLRIYIDLSATYTKNVLPDLIYNFLRQHCAVDDVFTKLFINHPYLLQNCQHMIIDNSHINPVMSSVQFAHIDHT